MLFRFCYHLFFKCRLQIYFRKHHKGCQYYWWPKQRGTFIHMYVPARHVNNFEQSQLIGCTQYNSQFEWNGHYMMTNEFEEELVMEEKISLGFEKLLKLYNVIDLVNTNSKHDKNNEKLHLYDKFKTLLSSESFLSGLNQVNSFSLNFWHIFVNVILS